MLHRVLATALLGRILLGSGIALAADPQLTAIPPNHRAIAVKVDPADEKAGLIAPGSKVDVVQTKKLNGEKTESKVILRNLLVLAVDVQIDSKQPKKIEARTITLAVPANDAPALVAAIKAGILSFRLAQPDDGAKSSNKKP